MLVLVVLAAVLAFGSGCGGTNPTSGLHRRLLAVADLPAGWSTAPTTGATTPKVSNTPCLSNLSSHPKGWQYTSAAFVEGSSIPNFGEVLAQGTGVRPAWRRLGAALDRCREATLHVGGTTVQAGVQSLAFPRLGVTSSAYAWSFTLAGVRIGFDLVLFQTADYGGYLSYADLGAPKLSTVAAFARAAVTKATKGSTARVPDNVSITAAPIRTAHTTLGAVAYRTVGHGSPVLMITGYSGTMEAWDRRFVDALAEHHQVITFDNAGVGGTAALPQPLTIDAMADQSSALIIALHLGPTNVLGWSMGSMIAQALTVRHPDQVHRLILCASYPGDGSTVRPSRQELNSFESGQPGKVLAALFPADQRGAQSTYIAAISSYPSAPPVPAGVLAEQRHAVDSWWNGTDPAGRQTATIAVPTLIADGTVDRLDPVANSHRLAALIPAASLKLYPDAGHAFLFQDQAGLVPIIGSFIGAP